MGSTIVPVSTAPTSWPTPPVTTMANQQTEALGAEAEDVKGSASLHLERCAVAPP